MTLPQRGVGPRTEQKEVLGIVMARNTIENKVINKKVIK